MNQTFLEEFCDAITSLDTYPVLARTGFGIVQSAEEPHPFIAPALRAVESSFNGSSITAGQPDVVLITAPAAVGKSTLARALSHRAGVPLWDLSQFRVGSNFFTGTIARAYGGLGLAKFEELFKTGGGCIILDAADEALVRAGLGNFEAAIQDLVELIGDGKPGHTKAVMLGRPETVEAAALALSDTRISWRILAVDFFDEAASREFVRTKLMALSGGSPISNLNEFLDRFFRIVGSALSSNETGWSEESRPFLGYAPVLDTLTSYVANAKNPYAAIEGMNRAGRAQAVAWELLIQVVDQLCERETERLSTSFGGESPELKALGAQVYAPERQLRMLSTPEPAIEDIWVPAGTDAAIAHEVREAALRQLSDHPFLRVDRRKQGTLLERFANVAFRDYVTAWTLSSGPPLERAQFVRDLSSPTVNPSPLLLRFFALKYGKQQHPFSSDAISFLVESCSADVSVERQPSLSLVYSPSDRGSEGNERSLALEVVDAGQVLANIEFELAVGERLTLGRSATNLRVDLRQSDVLLGRTGRDFLFTGQVEISARSISVQAEDVRVGGPGRPNNVTLRSADFFSNTRRISVSQRGIMAVEANSLAYPWRDYEVTTSDDRTSALIDAGLELRTLLRWFYRQTTYGTISPSTMQNILAKNKAPVLMFEYCLSKGAILGPLMNSHKYYEFKPPASSQSILDVDLTDAPLRKFLEGYISTYGK